VYSPDGQHSLNRQYQIFFQDAERNNHREVKLIPFPLTNPNHPAYPDANGMFDGDPIYGWPASNDVHAWREAPFEHPRSAIEMPTLKPAQGLTPSSEIFVDEENRRQESNTTPFEPTFNFITPFNIIYGDGLFDLIDPVDFKESRTQTTAFSQSLAIQASRIVAPGEAGDIISYSIRPFLLYPSSESNWLPRTHHPHAAPWCLSYKVEAVSILPPDDLFDADGDGVPNYREAQLGLDPNDPDSDGDLINDGLELSLNLDPKRHDGALTDHFAQRTRDLNLETPIIERDENGFWFLRVGLEAANDLGAWEAIDLSEILMETQAGDLVFRFPDPGDDAIFYRLNASGAP